MNIVDAYRRTGSYRAAAAICGVNHKTVRRVVERSRRGRFERQPAPRRPRNTDQVADLVAERVVARPTGGSPPSACCRWPARPDTPARPATCAGAWPRPRPAAAASGGCTGPGCRRQASTW